MDDAVASVAGALQELVNNVKTDGEGDLSGGSISCDHSARCGPLRVGLNPKDTVDRIESDDVGWLIYDGFGNHCLIPPNDANVTQ